MFAHIVAPVIVAVILGLRFAQIDGRTSPDASYYMNIVVGRGAPSPYRYRMFVPWLTMLGVKLTKADVHKVMRAIVTTGTVACAALCYLFTLTLGANPWTAALATTILLATDALFGAWIMFPWLADPWAMAFAVAACCVDPISASILLFLAALAKEGGWLLGSAFIISVNPALWWVAVPGLVALVALRLIFRPTPPDTEWLEQPARYAWVTKRRKWLNYKYNLSGLKLIPVGCALFLPAQWTIPVVIVVGLAYAQTWVSVDHQRLIALAAVFVVPICVLQAPDWVLFLWALASVYWPYETGFGAEFS